MTAGAWQTLTPYVHSVAMTQIAPVLEAFVLLVGSGLPFAVQGGVLELKQSPEQ